MKSLKLIFVAAILSLATAAHAQVKVRVMSHNLATENAVATVESLEVVSDLACSSSADVVAFQSIPCLGGEGSAEALKMVANNSLMHFSLSSVAGLGVISKDKPLKVKALDNAIQVVEFKDFVLYNVDFAKGVSYSDLVGYMSKSDKPTLLAATDVDAELLKSMEEDFKTLSSVKQLTYPSSKPTKCVDYLFGYTANDQSYSVPNTKTVGTAKESTHRAVYADVRLKFPKDRIFRTKPYLQNPVGNGMTVMWLTSTPTHSWVEYGTDTTNLTRVRRVVDGQVICNNFTHKIRLENLEPGTRYYYRVCSRDMMLYRGYLKEWGDTAVSQFYSFTTSDTKDSDFTALIFNDIHQHTDIAAALYDRVKDLDCDMVFFNGDCIDDPLDESQAVRSISALNNIVNAAEVPVFYMRGNHEIRNAYSIGLRELFDYVEDKTYAAFTWGDTRFVLLDGGEDKPDDFWVYYDLNDFEQFRLDQVEFMKREFKSKEFKKADNRVLIHHIPMYGNTVNKYQPCLPLWVPVLEGVDFDYSINAHTHSHKYFPAGCEKGNTYPVIIGGGYGKNNATVMVLSKKNGKLSLKVLDYYGKPLLEL